MLHPWVLLNRTQSLEHHQKRTSRGLEAKGVAYSLQRKLILQLVKTSFCVSKPQDTIRPEVAWVLKFVQPDLFEVSSFEFPFNIQQEKGITFPSVQSPTMPVVQVQHWSIGVCQEQWVLCVEIWVKSSGIRVRKLRRFPLQLSLEMLHGNASRTGELTFQHLNLLSTVSPVNIQCNRVRCYNPGPWAGSRKPNRQNTIPQSRFKTSTSWDMKSPGYSHLTARPKKRRCKFSDSCCNARASNDRVMRSHRSEGTAALEASSYLSPKIPRSEADQLRKQTALYLYTVLKTVSKTTPGFQEIVFRCF